MPILPDDLGPILEPPEILEASEVEDETMQTDLAKAFIEGRKTAINELTSKNVTVVLDKLEDVTGGTDEKVKSGFVGSQNNDKVRAMRHSKKCTLADFFAMTLTIRTKEPNHEFAELSPEQQLIDAHETDCRSYYQYLQTYVAANLMSVKEGLTSQFKFLQQRKKSLSPNDQQFLQEQRFSSQEQFNELGWEQFLVLLQSIEEGSVFSAANLRSELISQQGIQFGDPWRRRIRAGLDQKTSRFRTSIKDEFESRLQDAIKTAHLWLPPWLRAYCLSGLYASEMVKDPTIVSLLKA